MHSYEGQASGRVVGVEGEELTNAKKTKEFCLHPDEKKENEYFLGSYATGETN